MRDIFLEEIFKNTHKFISTRFIVKTKKNSTVSEFYRLLTSEGLKPERCTHFIVKYTLVYLDQLKYYEIDLFPTPTSAPNPTLSLRPFLTSRSFICIGTFYLTETACTCNWKTLTRVASVHILKDSFRPCPFPPLPRNIYHGSAWATKPRMILTDVRTFLFDENWLLFLVFCPFIPWTMRT